MRDFTPITKQKNFFAELLHCLSHKKIAWLQTKQRLMSRPAR